MPNDSAAPKSPAFRWLVVAGFLILLAPTGVSQEAFPAWVGLYDPSHLGWLENENRLSELCPDASSLADCHSVTLRPAVSLFALHVEPDHASPQVGELVTVAVPGRGLSAHFRPIAAGHTSPFVPDLFLQDWGYGPYFHHTTSARQGDWFRLPPDPWERDVWVYRASEEARSSVILVQAGDIIELNGSGMYVVTAERDALELRPEQPADLWCAPGDPPALAPAEVVRYARLDLVDSRGHLIFRPKYLKGC